VAVTTASNLSLTNVVALAGGAGHTCALLASGTVRCWGSNAAGKLGDGTIVNRITPVAVSNVTSAVAIQAGNTHTCALLVFGTAKCWGSNQFGQIGDGTMTSRLTPVDVGTPSPAGVLINAVAIKIGDFHTCALLADGSAKCWGLNNSGQLGISNTAPANIAPTAVLGGGGSISARDIAAGRNHTCAVRANGTVACWGSNDSGQLGDGTIATRLSPVAVTGLFGEPVVAIAAGEAHTCALVAFGSVRCWGDNLNGQLGDGTTDDRLTPVIPLFVGTAVAIATGGTLGSSHTCALLANGTVRCWGANGSGQLGDGTTTDRHTPTLVRGLTNAVAIAVGESHTCALVAAGVPFCWGFNGNGRLGDGTSVSRTLPTLVSLDNAVAIAGGNTHTCALRVDATSWCWGGNLLGQLGIGSTASQFAPRLVVNLFNPIAVAGGFGHSCALLASGGLTSGSARCWGDNSVGQLGDSTTVSALTPVTVKSVKTIGGLGGSFTIANPLASTVGITTGRRHSCALLATGRAVCWGENGAGQLGIGSITNQASPVPVLSFALNIDPSVELKPNNRVSTVTILANCDEGERLHVNVSLTQGGVSGHGVGVGECTAGLGRYLVQVPAQGRDGFVEGPAEVSAEARIAEGGTVVDTQEWTRKVQIVSAPGKEDEGGKGPAQR
jgi:alpha-tubulin suppressor-like RCC1 family protein